MGKIGIIIRREYFTRIRNRTFIVMCFLAPLFFAGLVIVPPLLAGKPGAPRKIVVVDASGIPDSLSYAFIFKDTLNLRFDYSYVYKGLTNVESAFKDSDQVSILYIPENFMGGGDTTQNHSIGLSVILKSTREPGFNTLNLLQSVLSAEVQRDMMKRNGISQRVMDLTLKKVAVDNEVKGHIGISEIKAVTGLIFGMVIYVYILLFGVLVMKGVVEEKTTRIVEVIVSSVKPFQLMLGKIIGVALVGLTQFTAWIVLSFAIIIPVINHINEYKTDISQHTQANMTTGVAIQSGPRLMNFDITEETQKTVETIMSIPWGNLIPAFLFYFIFGYLMYAAIFAAIGSGADKNADTSQFSAPVTIPLIISIASSASVLNDPDGPIAKWLSMIPFTSPVVMLMRIPFGGVMVWELLLSVAILIVSFLLMTWLAGKIYRVGILMYGKKITWKELGKWLFYKP
ncbi:MAG TPA: ABC transporter permease [Bacteroidia bacterium]|nr:ABC transporter permease [Bacteroidia bacterium]